MKDETLLRTMMKRDDFFSPRGVVKKTVKKLNWSPDIIHVTWLDGVLLPLY